MRALPPVLLVALSACTFDQVGQPVGGSSGGSGAASDADRVFAAAGTGANTAVLQGIWEGEQVQKAQTLESKSRFEFRDTFVVAAARCTMPGEQPVVVGGRSAATVTAGLVEIKEAISATKYIGDGALCGVRASAGLLPECDPNVPTTQRSTCFDLSGGKLTLFQGGAAQTYVKIAD